MKRFQSFRELIDEFGQHKLARAVGVKPGAVRAWHLRNNIPADHYAAVVDAGEGLDVAGVGFDELYRLAALRKGNPPQHSEAA